MVSTWGRLLDLFGAAFDAWRLGAFAALMMAIGTVGATLLLALPLALLAALVEAVIGVPIDLASGVGGGTWVTLLALIAVPVGIGLSIPYLRPGIAEYEESAAERRKRALLRKYPPAI